MKKIILVFLILIIISFANAATYQDISPKVLIQDSDIIVRGKIVNIKFSQEGIHIFDTGIISVNKVLKGEKIISEVNIIFSGKNSVKKSSLDICYKLEDKGIWMLKKIENNSYRVYHPDCFQNESTEKVIQYILKHKPLSDFEKIKSESDDFAKLLIVKYLRHEGIESSIPLLINMLSEKKSDIVNNSNKALYRITNQIFIDKDEILPEEKKELAKKWRVWWEINKNYSREKWVKQGIERDIKLLNNKDADIRAFATKRLLEFTGQYGFVGSGYAPQTPEAIGKWERWWPDNKDKPMREWAISLLTSNDPVHRQYGITLAVDLIKFGDTELYSYLIKVLMDQYDWLAQYAIEGLYMLTGEKFGFMTMNPPEKNLKSIKLWMDWYNKNIKEKRHN
ncbi:MAG: hypothetical protein HY934_03345 [Candidatus Firestonebacteria bacterium]|nr:hypothetical protein [Candidatus Firestonebacteria bacterium]